MNDRPSGYEVLGSGAGVLARDDRAVLRVGGRDPVRMLHGLITNDLAGAAEGDVVYAAFLTPKGRMVADARVVRRGGEALVETAAAAEAALRAHLRKYVPPLFARVEEQSGLAVLGVYGPRAGDVLAAVLDALGDAVALPALDVPAGTDLVVHAAALDTVREGLLAAGALPVSREALEVRRIEAGLPRWGAELDETVIPLEAGLKERAISTTKGCYTGQEVIVRILHRGHVNRHLRGLLLGDVAPPAPGTSLTLPGSDRSVGAVTSACASPALGETIALAYVRREVEAGARVRAGEGEGLLVELPFPLPR